MFFVGSTLTPLTPISVSDVNKSLLSANSISVLGDNAQYQTGKVVVVKGDRNEMHHKRVLVKFSGLTKMLGENLVTFNETYLAAVSNQRVLDPVKAPKQD